MRLYGAGHEDSWAEMYIADERFAHSYEHVLGGLAAYVHDATVANADGRQTLSQ